MAGWFPLFALPTQSDGATLINGFDLNGQSFAFINFLKLSSGTAAFSSSFAYPAVLDANGYPNNSGASLATSIGFSVFPPTSQIGTSNLVIKWDGDGAIQLSLNNTVTVSSSSGCSVTGSGTSNLTIVSNNSSSSPRVVFNFPSGGPEARLDFIFPSGRTYTNMRNAVFCRASQEATLDGGDIWNPDFIALMTLLNPRILRLMDWNGTNASLIAQHSHRWPTAALGYRSHRFAPECWAGTASLASNAYTCSAVPSGFNGTLVHGATVQVLMDSNSNSGNHITVSNTANNGSGLIRATTSTAHGLSTGARVAFSSDGGWFYGSNIWTVTVINSTTLDFQGSSFQNAASGKISTTTFSCNGSTPKLMCSQDGVMTTVGTAVGDAKYYTFVYNSILDAWVGTNHGLGSNPYGAVPVEMHVALCNKLNVDYWSNIHFDYTDAAVQSHVEYVRDNLNSNLTAYYEYSNEVWNLGADFLQMNHANMLGQTFGYPTESARSVYGWYGLRVRQIMAIVKTAYDATGNTKFKRVMAFQGGGSPTTTKDYRLNGTDLVTGNAKYNTWTGSTSYNTFPNRPVDVCDTLSYGTYYAGGTIFNHGIYAPSGTYTGMTAAADDYASGNPVQMAAALDWVDDDIRTGVTTMSGQAEQTLLHFSTNIYPAWETVAASYDAQRTGAGMAKLSVHPYEGGLEGEAPDAQDCTDIGISTTYAAKVSTMYEAYKMDARFQTLVTDQMNQHAAAHSARPDFAPSWFALQGPSKWSMMTGDTYSTKYKSFDANRVYNGN